MRRSAHVRSLFAALWASGAFEELTGAVIGRRCHVPHWSAWRRRP
jgi:hypothetical protein